MRPYALRSTDASLEFPTVAGGFKGDPYDRDAFSREALAHVDHLYRVAFHLAKEPHAAQDLVQETYARAFGAFVQFEPGTNMKAWLTRILRNFFLDEHYHSKKWVPLEGENTGGVSEEGLACGRSAAKRLGPEEQFLNKELSGQIRDALAGIPSEFRSVIVLVDIEDLSYTEAAAVLNCPIGTIRSRLSRGRWYLLKQLKAYVTIDEEG